jgi:mRNA-degrading endonuclease toxin of MazEF toxin-antitoxin module
MPPVRGEIWETEYEPIHLARPFEQAGLRPALIISSDRLNARGCTCIAVPISGTGRPAAWYVPLPAGVGGLTKPSVALCDQVRGIAQSRLRYRRGVLTPEQVQAVVTRLLHTIT